MKRDSFLCKNLIFLVFICFLFAPYLTLNGTNLNILNIIFENINIWLTVSFVCFVISFVFYFVFQLLNKRKYSLFVFLISIVSFVVGNIIIFANLQYFSYEPAFIFICLLIGILFFDAIKRINSYLVFSINEICQTALFLGIALIMDVGNLKLRILPNGGSLSFTMIPLIFLAIRLGFFKGFFALGIIYGLLNCLLDGFGLFSFPLDYLLAFGSLSFVGLFKKVILPSNKKVNKKGVIILVFSIAIGVFLRFIFASLSGYLVWGYTIIGSVLANASYLVPDLLLTIIIILLLYKPFLLLQKRLS